MHHFAVKRLARRRRQGNDGRLGIRQSLQRPPPHRDAFLGHLPQDGPDVVVGFLAVGQQHRLPRLAGRKSQSRGQQRLGQLRGTAEFVVRQPALPTVEHFAQLVGGFELADAAGYRKQRPAIVAAKPLDPLVDDPQRPAGLFEVDRLRDVHEKVDVHVARLRPQIRAAQCQHQADHRQRRQAGGGPVQQARTIRQAVRMANAKTATTANHANGRNDTNSSMGHPTLRR